MKKIILTVMVALGATTTMWGSTQVNQNDSCHCSICTACDSLDVICSGEAPDSIEDADGHKWPVYIKKPGFLYWYNRLADLVADDLNYWYYNHTVAEFDIHVREEYLNNPKFMHEMNEGWDGLCGDVYTTHSREIDLFYDIYNEE